MMDKDQILKAKTDIRYFDKLYEEYFPAIFRFVIVRVSNRDIAEEIVSNVFYKAMSKLHMFRWRSIPFSAWLYRIAISEISNYFRKEKRQWKIEQQVFDEVDVFKEEEEYFSYEFVHQYIKQLPQKDQDLIYFRFFEKRSFSEIAEIVGKKENTLRVNLHRALRKLEKLIPEEVLEDVYQKVS